MAFTVVSQENPDTPPADKTRIEPWAAWIGAATVVLIGAVAAFTAWDRMHTSELETVITPTAVGDTHYVPDALTKNGATGLKYQGTDLETVADLKVRDSKLLLIGKDDSGAYSIYRPEDEKELPRGRYYMKAKPNEYIEVTGK